MEQCRLDDLRQNGIFDLLQYRNRKRIFQDRQDAAENLAKLLPAWFVRLNPIILAISDAGYLLASSLAETLNLEVEFTPVQRVVLPWDAEIDFAAVAFDGTVYLDREMVDRNQLGRREVDKGIARAHESISRGSATINRLSMCRLKNRRVLLVDEGVATCAAVCAAIKSLQAYRCKQPTLAITTAYDKALMQLIPLFEYIFCTNVRSGFGYAADDVYKQLVVIENPEHKLPVSQSRETRRQISA